MFCNPNIVPREHVQEKLQDRVECGSMHTSSFFAHIANIHQDDNSIRNFQLVSSNRVHSTPLCEANKCRILNHFFVYQIKGV